MLEYLSLCEQRDLAGAARYLAEGAVLIFPGSRHYPNLKAMAEDAAQRYRWVRKHCDEINVFRNDSGETIVVSLGTLAGESLAGAPFQGIRYQDRFIVRDGQIVEQQVWNDLAASGVLDA